MLSDRPYLRDSYGRTSTAPLTWMLCVLGAGFIIQTVFERAFYSPHFEIFFGLTVRGLKSGGLWTLVTYPLLHANVVHWLVNLLAIYFLGKELTPQLGERRVAWLCAAAIFSGGLIWTWVHLGRSDMLMGATAIPVALLTLFACLHPNRSMRFLFFFFPVTMKPKHLAWAVIGLSALGLALSEIPGDRFGTHIAHSAHLGGALAALLYYRFVHLREWQTPDGRAELTLPRWIAKPSAPAPSQIVHDQSMHLPTPQRENLRAEVDRILDKISSQGIAALTAEEKNLLDEARNKMSRR
jgi:membrane associated rhomboid family serine protease